MRWRPGRLRRAPRWGGSLRRTLLKKLAFGLALAPAIARAAEPAPSPASAAAHARRGGVGLGDIVNARDFGAVGDGTTDDTVALQAGLDAAMARGKSFYLPGGLRFYMTTATLRVRLPGEADSRAGIRIFGDGPGGVRQGGSAIRLFGSGLDAILELEKAFARACLIENLTLMCQSARGAAAGILFNGSQFSNHRLRNVTVAGGPEGKSGPATAFRIVRGDGANGEFLVFENCNGFNVDRFFANDSGQSFQHQFLNCVALLNHGGTYFELGPGSGGFGISVKNFNASGEVRNGISNTRLLDLHDGSVSSPITIESGRIESLTQLFTNRGGSPSTGVALAIRGLEAGIDYDPGNPGFRLAIPDGVVVGGTTSDAAIVENCQFFAGTPDAAFPVAWTTQWACLTFRGCSFRNFRAPPYIVQSAYGAQGLLRFVDCRAPVSNAAERYVALDRNYDLFEVTAGKRRNHSQNGFAPSGVPSNLLVKPQVTLANGGSGEVAVDPPWVAYGAARPIAAWGWDNTRTIGSEVPRPRSSSPWSKHLEIAPKSGIYQDIAAIDLSSPGSLGGRGRDFYDDDNVLCHIVVYQALMTQLGYASGHIAIEDSVSGQVYDQFRWTGRGVWSSPTPTLVTLQAVVARGASPSHPRLRIENTDPENHLLFEFAWQYVSNQPNPTFAPSTHAAEAWREEWGVVAENLHAFGRLALPYKPDRFGMAAPAPLNDLHSDAYVSSDLERSVRFANAAWWQEPRSTRAPAIPTAGIWGCGDEVRNTAPAAGGFLGWVQVTPGDIACTRIWTPRTAFTGGVRVYHAAGVYQMTAPNGVSAAAGGPGGAGEAIRDGSCTWRFAGSLAPTACATAWSGGTEYAAPGLQVSNRARVFQLLSPGRSAATVGPDGTGHAIADGSCLWRYVGPLAVFKPFGAIGR